MHGKQIAPFTGVSNLRLFLIAIVLVCVQGGDYGKLITAAPAPRLVRRTVKHNHARRKKLIRKGGWVGGGFRRRSGGRPGRGKCGSGGRRNIGVT